MHVKFQFFFSLHARHRLFILQYIIHIPMMIPTMYCLPLIFLYTAVFWHFKVKVWYESSLQLAQQCVSTSRSFFFITYSIEFYFNIFRKHWYYKQCIASPGDRMISMRFFTLNIDVIWCVSEECACYISRPLWSCHNIHHNIHHDIRHNIHRPFLICW